MAHIYRLKGWIGGGVVVGVGSGCSGVESGERIWGKKAKIKPFSHISFTGTDGSWLWNFLIDMIYFQAIVWSPFGEQISFYLGEHGYARVCVCV